MTTTQAAVKENVRKARDLITLDGPLFRHRATGWVPCDELPLALIDWLLADPDRRAALRTIVDAS